jgi:hypothetical protein
VTSPFAHGASVRVEEALPALLPAACALIVRAALAQATEWLGRR